MSLLKYSNTRELTVKGNPDLFIDSFRKMIQAQLEIIEAKSEIQNNSIKFKRIVRNTTHSGMNKLEALKILREGLIRIAKKDSRKVEIFWEVNLDTLVFLSFLVGAVIGLLVALVSSSLTVSMLIGLLFSMIAYFIGGSSIKAKIDEIIETSIDKTTTSF